MAVKSRWIPFYSIIGVYFKLPNLNKSPQYLRSNLKNSKRSFFPWRFCSKVLHLQHKRIEWIGSVTVGNVSNLWSLQRKISWKQ